MIRSLSKALRAITNLLTRKYLAKGGQFPIPSGLKTLAGELGVTHEALYRAIAALQAQRVLEKVDALLVLNKVK